MHPAREHLEADHQVRALRVQRGQRLQLPAVVIHVVMLFAEQHDRALRHGRNQPGAFHTLRRRAIGPYPGARDQALRGICRLRNCRRGKGCSHDAGDRKRAKP